MPTPRISREKRALAIMALSEGTSVNSAARMTGVSGPALLSFFRECGESCEAWHDEHFRNLTVERLEIDEQWSYCFKHKERMTIQEKKEHPERGDCWLWGALDPVSKAIISWRTAKRTYEACQDFCHDIASRVVGEVQITSDALIAYKPCIALAFGDRAHCATELKEFHRAKEWTPDALYLRRRVDPLKAVHRKARLGNPDMTKATITRVERFWLTVRQSNKRTARKTLAYSKRWSNHAATTSLHTFIYNVLRPHSSLKGKTPAMALGITDKRWTAEMLVDMVDARRKALEELAFMEAFNTATFTSAPTVARKYANKPLQKPAEKPMQPQADWSGVPASWVNPRQTTVDFIYSTLRGEAEKP